MFEEMMSDTNEETLKRIFRTDLSNLVSSDMKNEQKTKNLKTKKNFNVLSDMSKPQNLSNSQQNIPEGAKPFDPNQKRQPVKVDKKIGRNDPCPCGSGKKYKKCHLHTSLD